MIGNGCAEDMTLWFFNLVHGKLSSEEVLKGFIKYYVLDNQRLGNAFDDLFLRSGYSLAENLRGANLLYKHLRLYAGVQDDDFEMDIDETVK